MKGLSIVGTIAMFLVAGGILTHAFHIDVVHIEFIQNFIIGLISGLITFLIISILNKLKKS